MIEDSGNRVILSITAKPGSGKFAVEFKGDKIAVSLENRAQNNRANTELIKEFRRILKKEVSPDFRRTVKGKKAAGRKCSRRRHQMCPCGA